MSVTKTTGPPVAIAILPRCLVSNKTRQLVGIAKLAIQRASNQTRCSASSDAFMRGVLSAAAYIGGCMGLTLKQTRVWNTHDEWVFI